MCVVFPLSFVIEAAMQCVARLALLACCETERCISNEGWNTAHIKESCIPFQSSLVIIYWVYQPKAKNMIPVAFQNIAQNYQSIKVKELTVCKIELNLVK